MARIIFFKKDLQQDKNRPILKSGVAKKCPVCKHFLNDDDLRALTNGLVIACKNCNTIIEAECR